MVKDLNIHVAKKVYEMNAVRVVNDNDGKLQNVLLYSLCVGFGVTEEVIVEGVHVGKHVPCWHFG